MFGGLYFPMDDEIGRTFATIEPTTVPTQQTSQGEAGFPYWIIAVILLGAAGAMAGKVIIDYAYRKYGKKGLI